MGLRSQNRKKERKREKEGKTASDRGLKGCVRYVRTYVRRSRRGEVRTYVDVDGGSTYVRAYVRRNRRREFRIPRRSTEYSRRAVPHHFRPNLPFFSG